jgi:hypothetical protein
MLKFLLGSAAITTALLLSQPSKADIVVLGGQNWDTTNAATLTVMSAVPAGNQVDNIPCIICGAHQPQQPAGFGYNLFGNTGNANTVSFFSTAVFPSQGGSGLGLDQIGTGYSLANGSPLLNAIGGRIGFTVGLDVNDSSQAQTLESFWFLNLTQHTVLGVFSPGPGGMLIPDINNGTGFPDYTISGLTLEGINAGDQVIFFSRITDANDGPDSFFINPVIVPGPIAGAGIPGLLAAFGIGGFMWRRRKIATA